GGGKNSVPPRAGRANAPSALPKPYMVGGTAFGSPNPPLTPGGASPGSTSVTVVSDPFVRLTTFTGGGDLVRNNIVVNGNFETPDLTTERGNLDGWRTFDQNSGAGLSGSAGAWGPQKLTSSPQSLTPVPRLG